MSDMNDNGRVSLNIQQEQAQDEEMAGGVSSLPNETLPSSARSNWRLSRLSSFGGGQVDVETEFYLIKCNN